MAAPAVSIKISVLIRDAGECPMCRFDSLRRATGYKLSPNGVTTVFDQSYCGRCIADLQEEL